MIILFINLNIYNLKHVRFVYQKYLYLLKEMGADFLFNQTNIALKNLKDARAKDIDIVCDGNRVNQFFSKNSAL